MFGRIFFVILFFWAALTVITPILVRLSASSVLLDNNGEMTNGSIYSKEISLSSRRALGSVGHPQIERQALSIPSPSPSPSQPHMQTTFELEVSGDMKSSFHTKKQKTVTLNHMELP